MADLPPATCSSCVFWREDGDRLLPEQENDVRREGDCILNPPTTYPVARENGTRGLLSVWSRTRESETCGAYEPRADDETEATG